MYRHFFYFVSVGLLVTSPLASALELSANLYSDVQYNSNVALTTTDTTEDVSQTLGLDLILVENSRRFTADANLNLEQEHYYNNTFADQTSLTTGFGIFNFDIIEDFLNWRTSFTRSEVLQNTFDADTPENREQRDIFTTGPAINYRLSQAATLGLSANFTNVENSDDDASDTERAGGNMFFGYTVNSTTSVSLSGSYDEVLDGDGTEELKSTNVSVGGVRQFSNGELSVSVGITESQSDIADTERGNYYNIRFSQRQLMAHDVVIQYRQDIYDTSYGALDFDQFTENFSQGNPDNTDAAITLLDIFTRDRLNISATRAIDSVSYTISGIWGRDDYEIQLQDYKTRGAGFDITYNIAPDLSTTFDYQFTLNDFYEQPEIGKEKLNEYIWDFDYRFSRDVTFSSGISFRSRANDNDFSREYEDKGIRLGINWELY